MVGFQDYLNAQMLTSFKNKKFQSRIIWTYFILRNLFHYGTFPYETIKDFILLIMFQEKTWTIYNSYVKSIKKQNKIIKTTY